MSDLLDADARCLDLLVEHGFSPLRQPALRKVLAHTVTLGQAARIRGLSEEMEEGLLAALLTLLQGSDGEGPQAPEREDNRAYPREAPLEKPREEAKA